MATLKERAQVRTTRNICRDPTERCNSPDYWPELLQHAESASRQHRSRKKTGTQQSSFAETCFPKGPHRACGAAPRGGECYRKGRWADALQR
eukprot:756756-Pyramimonas_sp.AAC.1